MVGKLSWRCLYGWITNLYGALFRLPFSHRCLQTLLKRQFCVTRTRYSNPTPVAFFVKPDVVLLATRKWSLSALIHARGRNFIVIFFREQMHRTLWCPKLQLIVLHMRTSRVCELLRSGSLIARSHNRSLITKTIYLNEHDLYVFYTKKDCYWFIPSCAQLL